MNWTRLLPWFAGACVVAILVGVVYVAVTAPGETLEQWQRRHRSSVLDIYCEKVPLDKCEIQKVTDIKRICVACEGGRTNYVIFTIDPKTKELKSLTLPEHCTKVLIDLPASKEGEELKGCWVELRQQQYLKDYKDSRVLRTAVIHVHSIKDIK